MKIFDCFMYFDEEIVLELRLNTLNEYVDYFVIVESSFTHKGDKRKLKFDHDKFSKFKDKIIYLVYDVEPKGIEIINENESKDEKSRKYIFNAIYRENGQRNLISEGLKIADNDDLILISDVDEIPNIKNIDFNKFKEKLIFFNQEMFYYKFNLKLPDYNWVGTRLCKKKYLKSPQWLRNIKNKKYPFYRFDINFSETKYSDIKFVNEGGWHFTNIKSAEEISHKLKSYLHHREFDVNPLSVEEINKLIVSQQAIYDLSLDKKVQKIGHGSKLEKYDLKKLPSYINNNLEKFKDWID
jgi:beta-1,4-mannosyl-glycoprotein beta-1,4-N-acetylglucosaminyltransferase